MSPRRTVEVSGNNSKEDLTKNELDMVFSALKRDLCNIIEASVPSDRQEGAKQLAKNEANRVRILMLRWFGLEEEGEYDAARHR